jgi:hypothetical protein
LAFVCPYGLRRCRRFWSVRCSVRRGGLHGPDGRVGFTGGPALLFNLFDLRDRLGDRSVAGVGCAAVVALGVGRRWRCVALPRVLRGWAMTPRNGVPGADRRPYSAARRPGAARNEIHGLLCHGGTWRASGAAR